MVDALYVLVLGLAATIPWMSSSEQIISLNGNSWDLHNQNKSIHITNVTVPSNVPDQLHAHGVVFTNDPRYGRTSDDVLDLMTYDNFTYGVTFTIPTRTSPSMKTELVFDGVDTAATIWLDSKNIGSTNNMHMQFAFDISELIQTPNATHRLEVEIESATTYATRVAAAAGDPNCSQHTRNYWPEKFGHNTQCSTYIRKNTGSFGWDCARAFVGQAIHKSVYLRTTPTLAFDQVVPIIESLRAKDAIIVDGDNNFSITTRLFVRVAAATTVTITVQGSWGGKVSTNTTLIPPTNGLDVQRITMPILQASNVLLWWANGLGDQNMYTLTTTITMPDASVIESQTTVGFRTFEYVGSVGNNTATTATTWPLFFRLNGQPMFSKGFNWMPVDVLITDVEAQREIKKQRLADAVAVGANSVRIWGGGVYEDETFYNTTDALGLLVLQDGSFFGKYTEDPSFLTLVADECTYNARTLAHRPSLVVWSGNNESPVYGNEKLFIGAQLATVHAENPNVVVMPSCPSNGWESLTPLVPRPASDKTAPHDSHYYGACGTIPDDANFGSEFGWPSAPVLASYMAVAPPDELKLSSDFQYWRSTIKNPLWTVEAHPGPNSTLTRTFPLLFPNTDVNSSADNTTASLERWLYLTQALQSKCVGQSVTSYRQSPIVMGSLIWSLNEIWTSPAWSSIQGDGKWKMLHYHSRRLYTPLFVSFVVTEPTSEATCKWEEGVDYNEGSGDGATDAVNQQECCQACADAGDACTTAIYVGNKPQAKSRCALSPRNCCWLKKSIQNQTKCPGCLSCTPTNSSSTKNITQSTLRVHVDSHLTTQESLSCVLNMHRWDAANSTPAFAWEFNPTAQPMQGEFVFSNTLAALYRSTTQPCSARDCFFTVDCSSNQGNTSNVFYPTTLANSSMMLNPHMTVVPDCHRNSDGSTSASVQIQTDAHVPHTFATSTLAGVFDDNDVLVMANTPRVFTFTSRVSSLECSAWADTITVYGMSLAKAQHPVLTRPNNPRNLSVIGLRPHNLSSSLVNKNTADVAGDLFFWITDRLVAPFACRVSHGKWWGCKEQSTLDHDSVYTQTVLEVNGDWPNQTDLGSCFENSTDFSHQCFAPCNPSDQSGSVFHCKCNSFPSSTSSEPPCDVVGRTFLKQRYAQCADGCHYVNDHWKSDMAIHLGGLWYSTPAQSHCDDSETASCNWRQLEQKKTINATCANDHVMGLVQQRGADCFDKCSSQDRKNITSDCSVLCFFETVLGNSNSFPNMTGTGVPAADLVTTFNRAFEYDDPSEGGCAPL
eukprot:m.49153 g.49153  ORF g.49153 m.49153 type:complete len:1286 (-) comp20958_c0_seq1:61-3918(-)